MYVSTKVGEALLDYFLQFFEKICPLSFSKACSEIYFTLFSGCNNKVKSIIMTMQKTNTDGRKLVSISLKCINN